MCMKKCTYLLLLLLCLPAACQREPEESIPRNLRESIVRQHTSSREEGASDPEAPVISPPDVYQTAIFFPDSVDWRAGDATGARILLMKNGEILGSVAVGDNPNPESHRVLDGQLWWDSTDGHQTVLSCNSQERFRYVGEERIQGLLCVDGAVHTLGQRPGGGFCYRINGEEVYSSADGMVLGHASDPVWPGGALQLDSIGVCYTVQKSDGSYEVLCGDRPVKTARPAQGAQVLDVRLLNGAVYALENRSDDLYLLKDADSFPLKVKISSTRASGRGSSGVHPCHLVVIDGEMMVNSYSADRRPFVYWLRDAEGVRYQCSTIWGLQGFFAGEGEWAAVELDATGCVSRLIRNDGDISFPAQTFRLSLDRCAAFRKGCFAVALTADTGNDHWIQMDDRSCPIQFNGYFTGTYIE